MNITSPIFNHPRQFWMKMPVFMKPAACLANCKRERSPVLQLTRMDHDDRRQKPDSNQLRLPLRVFAAASK